VDFHNTSHYIDYCNILKQHQKINAYHIFTVSLKSSST